ncbi:hypothetical protein [Actinoplanes cyaneus]|nr:hypothetical protein [Actinoplanes cyaneus]
MVLILECRSHLDLGDLPNLLAAELGVMTVRLERAIRSLDDVARVHVNRWGDGSAHLHMWFLARPYGRLQLRGTFLSLWDDILPVIPEQKWRENLSLVAAWLADFGGRAIAEPAHIEWESPATLNVPGTDPEDDREEATRPATLDDVRASAAPADPWVRHNDDPSAGSPPPSGPLADTSTAVPPKRSSLYEFTEGVWATAANPTAPRDPAVEETTAGATDRGEAAWEGPGSDAWPPSAGGTATGTPPEPSTAGVPGPSGDEAHGSPARDGYVATGAPSTGAPSTGASRTSAPSTGAPSTSAANSGVLSTGAAGTAAGAGDHES